MRLRFLLPPPIIVAIRPDLPIISCHGHPPAAQVDVHSQRFLQTLTRLDECIGYISANQHFMDAPAYLLRFRTLQNRCARHWVC